MRGRWITLVLTPVILRIFIGYMVHEVITIGLGQDGCSRNGHHIAVTLHDGGMRYSRVRNETVAIYEQMLGTHFQLVYGPMHGRERCLEDVYPVYLLIINHTYCPCQRLTLNYRA